MKFEDIVACVGEGDAVLPAAAVAHGRQEVGRDDWKTYMAEHLWRGWNLLRAFRADECQAVELLDRATFADWEEFCWRFSRRRQAEAYSQALCALDGMG